MFWASNHPWTTNLCPRSMDFIMIFCIFCLVLWQTEVRFILWRLTSTTTSVSINFLSDILFLDVKIEKWRFYIFLTTPSLCTVITDVFICQRNIKINFWKPVINLCQKIVYLKLSVICKKYFLVTFLAS